jgi:hypothetical protein
VAGQGALTVVTNDAGGAKSKSKTGEFIIVPEHGSVQFWDLGSNLIIDGKPYTLVGDIKTLASDIAANPSGFYALAKPYDASADGKYLVSPVPTAFTGVFDGLGNVISRLSMLLPGGEFGGFFHAIYSGGIVRHSGFTDVVAAAGANSSYGILAGANEGEVARAWALGILSPGNGGQNAGGLVGGNIGTIDDAFAKVKIESTGIGLMSNAGGLVGLNRGIVRTSYADGSIIYRKGSEPDLGGLVGSNEGVVENCFALNSIHDGQQDDYAEIGGLAGTNDNGGRIDSSYAADIISQRNDENAEVGGLVGFDGSKGGIDTSYWDLQKGINDPSKGAGNIPNDPGIMGLTTEQLQSALPERFDPKIWAIDPKINGGYPYLLANPPK